MKRIDHDFSQIHEIERSRFICFVATTRDDAAAKRFIQSIQQLHPHATHHCYAYVIGDPLEIQRASDDGEPARSAGIPILETIHQAGYTDITAVVVRYFGGIKLGKNGLIRAYRKVTSDTLRLAPYTVPVIQYTYQLTFGYAYVERLEQYFRSQHMTILNKTFGEQVIFQICAHTTTITSDIKALCAGHVNIEAMGQTIIEVKGGRENDEY